MQSCIVCNLSCLPDVVDGEHESDAVCHPLFTWEWVSHKYRLSAFHVKLVHSQHCTLIIFPKLISVHLDAVLGSGLQVYEGTPSHLESLLSTLELTVVLQKDKGVLGRAHDNVGEVLVGSFIEALAARFLDDLGDLNGLFSQGHQLHVDSFVAAGNGTKVHHSVDHFLQAIRVVDLARCGVRFGLFGEGKEMV